MRIIDTFLFSEPHEEDLLYLKFKLENNYVDKWIIQENAYTLQGDKKNLYAEDIVNQGRFAEFWSKIIIESRNQQFIEGKNEDSNFQRERIQRAFCFNYLNYCDENDIIIVSDTDESFDFSDYDRTKRWFDIMLSRPAAWIGRRRYWYDYDNECRLKTIRIPCVRWGLLKNNPDLITQVRYFNDPNCTFDNYENPIAFEYSYVFKSVDELLRKKQTYAHTGFDRQCLEDAVKCNHWPRPTARGEALGSNECDFFETIKLTPENSPAYVRENLGILKTHLVDPNYKQNRIDMYGDKYKHLCDST